MSSIADDDNRLRDSDEEMRDSEGEGDDLRQQEVFDSSEEEDDDDEEEIQKIRDGFIVDDEEDDDVARKRKKKHKRRRKEKEPSQEDEGLLDEDDLELVMENTGAARSKSKSEYKRLKKAAVEEQAQKKNIDAFFSDDDDEQMISGDDDNNNRGTSRPSAGRAVMDELDDFIEDDEDSEMDEYERQQAKERRQQERLRPTEITGIDSEKIDELYEIFGDGEDYAWALEGEDEDGEFRDDDARPQLQDIYEPEELKARMLTDADKVIRDTDIPERYQMIRNNIKNYELDDEDFEFEKVWVAHRMLAEKNDVPPDFDREAYTRTVGDALTFMCRKNMDVPFIMSHRRDHLLKTVIVGEGENAQTQAVALIEENGLWRLVQLDIEFHALLAKRNQVMLLMNQLDITDEFAKNAFGQARTLTDLQDVHDFIMFEYSQKIKDLNLKKSAKPSIFDKVKKDRLYEIIQAVGITAADLASNITADAKIYTTKDHDVGPTELAEDICLDESSLYAKVSQALDVTKRYFAEELFNNLTIRGYLRDLYRAYARVSIELTEAGRKKIDKNSPYADFKYAINRTHESFNETPDLFLRMLEAEAQHLVEIKFELADYENFYEKILQFFTSDGQSDVANEWNSFRRDALSIAMKKLTELVTLNIKEDIRRECERFLFYDVRSAFLKKIDQAPYPPAGENQGVARVFAMTGGEGRFGIDAVVAAVLDEEGKLLETYKFVENPKISGERAPGGSTTFEMSFSEAIRESQPDVIVINGFNTNTNKLYKIVQDIIQEKDLKVYGTDEPIQVIYVNDEVAVRYQHSQRALEEFPDKPTLVRYAIGLARYTQSPLLEYVNLGPEVLSLSIHKHQNLLSEDKLKEALDTGFVDIVNMTGIDINRCVGDSYLASSLKYISGLGERKAVGLLRAVQQHPLFSRQALITNENIKIGATIFLNCASFLRIPQSKTRAVKSGDDVEAVTVLDDTRIHPEDYSLAEKMCADALDYDEDQIEELRDAPAGETIIDRLLEQPNRGSDLLHSLVLEDYSRELEESYGKKKRATLAIILEELEEPYAEIRASFKPLEPNEIFERLTGESLDTFHQDAVVPVLVKRVNDYRVFALTSSRIECNAIADDCKDPSDRRRLAELFPEGQSVPALVKSVDIDNFTAEVILKPEVVARAPTRVYYNRAAGFWDFEKEAADLNQEKTKQEKQQRAVRVIKHPLFHNYNAAQAQNELAAKERGAALIRPSSLGNDHIAITWKVDTNLYQHVNVVEHDKENEYSLGKYLTVDKQRFSDLDEILETYVGEIAKRVNQMTQHDKFRAGSKDEVTEWLENYAKANPKRGVYTFAFNYKRPGSFLLLFKTNASSKLYTWNVRTTPAGFELNGYNYPTMDQLCNGFKTLIKNQGRAGGAAGGPATNAAPAQNNYRGGNYGGYGGGGYGGYGYGGNNAGAGYAGAGYASGYNGY